MIFRWTNVRRTGVQRLQRSLQAFLLGERQKWLGTIAVEAFVAFRS